MFCARCGRKPEGSLIEGLCLQCFVETRGIPLNYRLEVEQCPSCGRYRVAGRWAHLGSQVDKWARERLLKVFEKLMRGYDVLLEDVSVRGDSFVLTLSVGGRKAVLRGALEKVARRTPCPVCSRSKVEAYEAVVQVRAGSAEDLGLVRALVERALQTVPEERAAEVLSVEELEEGVDVKTLSHSAARLIANQIRSLHPAVEVRETHKVVGMKGGKRRSKLTISVRLLRSSCYSVVGYDEGPALAELLPSGRVILITWRGAKEVLKSRELGRRARPFKGTMREAVVLEAGEEEVLVEVDGQVKRFSPYNAKLPLTRGSRALLIEDDVGHVYLFPLSESIGLCEGL